MFNCLNMRIVLIFNKNFNKWLCRWVLMGKTFWWNLSGVIIQWIYNVVAIYFAFGFCATYYYQRTTFFIAFVTTVLADLIIVEVLWEFVIAVLYAIRKKGRCILTLCEFLSRMRNVKQVV